MTRETHHFSGVGESTRRSFVTRGSLLAGGLALGLSGSGRAKQVDGEDEVDQQALLYRADFRPGARFRVVSPTIDWRPVGEGPLYDADLFDGFGTRAILYVDEGGDDDDDNGSDDDDGTDDGNGDDDDGNNDDDDDETASPRFLFPSDEAEVQEGQFYEFGEDATPVSEADDLPAGNVGDDPDAGEGLVVVTFRGVASTPTPDGTPTPTDEG